MDFFHSKTIISTTQSVLTSPCGICAQLQSRYLRCCEPGHEQSVLLLIVTFFAGNNTNHYGNFRILEEDTKI